MGGECQLIFKYGGHQIVKILAVLGCRLVVGLRLSRINEAQEEFLPVLLSISWRVATNHRHLLLISMNDRGSWLSEAGNLEWFRTWSHLLSCNLPAFVALTIPNSAGCLSHQQQGAKPTGSCFWDSLLAEVSHFLSHKASFGVNKSKWRTGKLWTV